MIKMKKKRIGKILILSLFVILLFSWVGFVAAAENQTIDDFLKEKDGFKEFMKLSPENREKLWEESLKKEKGYSYSRDALVEKITQEIVEQKLYKVDELFKGGGEVGAALEKAIVSSLGMSFLEKMKEQGISKLNVGIFGADLDKLKDLLQKNNVDLRSKIEEVKGFGSNDLKWSGKYIVGNGKVWLDLENLPMGVNALEYKNGNFVLKFGNGREVVLGDGATDKDGKLSFVSKLSDASLKKFIKPDNAGGLLSKLSNLKVDGSTVGEVLGQISSSETSKSLGVSDFSFLGGSGQIVVGKDGFEIKGGDAKIKYGDFIFGRKTGEVADSSVGFYNDRLVLKGTEFTRDGYVRVGSTKENFVVNFEDLPAAVASFTDYRDMDVMKGGSYMGAGAYPAKQATSVGKIFFKFDDTGKLTHVSKEGISNGDWVSVSTNLEESGALAEIYGKSGTQVQGLIKKANGGDYLDYGAIKNVFYDKEGYLRRDTNDLKVDSLQGNFLNINGENFNIGGTGRIEILKDVNSLTGYDAKAFNVKVGDGSLVFKEGKIFYPTVPMKNSVKIDDISVINNGKTSGQGFSLVVNSNGEKIFSESREFTAGRQTLLLPGGGSLDASLHIPSDNLADLSKRLGSGDRDQLAKELQNTPFEFDLSLFVPSNGIVSIDPSKEKAEIRKEFIDGLKKSIRERAGSGGEMAAAIKEDTIDAIAGLVFDASGNSKYGNDQFRLGVKNNPGSSPSLIYYQPDGTTKPVNLDINSNDPLEKAKAIAVQDFLNIVAHTPSAEKADVKHYSYNGFWGSLGLSLAGIYDLGGIQPNNIGPGKYAERLWINYFGRQENQLTFDKKFWEDLINRRKK